MKHVYFSTLDIETEYVVHTDGRYNDRYSLDLFIKTTRLKPGWRHYTLGRKWHNAGKGFMLSRDTRPRPRPGHLPI